MTRDEWQNATEPQAMLTWLRESGKLSERKARLFAVAVCRRIWPLLAPPVSRTAVEIAELFADGLKTTEELRQTWEVTEEVCACLTDAYLSNPLDPSNEYDAVVLQAGIHLGAISAAAGAATAAVGGLQGELSVLTACQYASEAAGWAAVPAGAEYDDTIARQAEQVAQAALIRDIVAPFRTAPFDPAYRTSEMVAFATTIYASRSFERLAELADALVTTGRQADAELLAHLRGPRPHAGRGCWALDCILGKE